MSGLILKDLYYIKANSRMYLIVMVLFGIYTYIMNSMEMLVFYIVFICVLMPVTVMGFDEGANWDRFAMGLPVSRRDLVISKYILCLILCIAATIFVSIIEIFNEGSPLKEGSLSVLYVFSALITIFSVMLPVLFKFGTTKGRMVVVAIAFLPTLLVVGLDKLGIQMPNISTLKPLAPYSPIFALILLGFSITISLYIYKGKEF